MHWLGIPVVPDSRHGGEKICCDSVLNRRELRNFHPDLQKYLREHGVAGTVMTGITKAQGGNRTVRELKKERAIEKEITREVKQNRWERTVDRTDRTIERDSRW